MQNSPQDHQELEENFSNPEWGTKLLRSISLFAYFESAELLKLYALGRILKLKSGAHAVIEGEPSRGLFILLSGKVSVYKTNKKNGKFHRLAMLEKGDAFGEISLFEDAPRSATVSAETLCYLFHLPVQKFEKFLQQEGESAQARFYKKCAEEMATRFRSQNGDYISSQQLLWQYALRLEDESA